MTTYRLIDETGAMPQIAAAVPEGWTATGLRITRRAGQSLPGAPEGFGWAMEVRAAQPEYDPDTERLESLDDELSDDGTVLSVGRTRAVALTADELAARARRVWATVTQFWGEFSDQERAAIALSDHDHVVVLRTELSMWRGEVWSDDPRVTGAVRLLAALGILGEGRAAEILEGAS
jgi:hypothetical protein